MKLIAYQERLVFPLQADKLNYLVIESPRHLDAVLCALKESADKLHEDVVLLREDKNILLKEAHILYSPLDCHYDKRDISKKLYRLLTDTIESSDLIQDYLALKSQCLTLLEHLYMNSPYDIDGEDDFPLETLFKYADVHIRPPEGPFPERLAAFITTMHRLLDKTVFILIGCQAYIPPDAYADLLNQCRYEGITLIMIEGHPLTPT